MTFTTLWANPADETMMMFFYFSQKTGFDISCKLSPMGEGGSTEQKYSETCVRQPPLRLTLVVVVEKWLSYKGTCHVILLTKLHDMYLYKTATFPHQPSLFKVWLRGGSLTQVSLYGLISIYNNAKYDMILTSSSWTGVMG